MKPHHPQSRRDFFDQNSPHIALTSAKTYHLTKSPIYIYYSNVWMITFKNKYDGSLVMSQQTHAQEVTSHFPVARLVTIGHFQSEQSLVVVAQWEEHALSVCPMFSNPECYFDSLLKRYSSIFHFG